MSFAAPLVLLGLLIIPALAVWYLTQQRRRAAQRRAFVTEPLTASVVPHPLGARRHVPILITALALAMLIAAAAKPQHSVAEPVRSATVMLANDVSDSMAATDVAPSRLAAAKKAAVTFDAAMPAGVRLGQISFARHPTMLQSPTADHRAAAAAAGQLTLGGGGTAIGDAINTALAAIQAAPKVNGKRPPGAILLISDGASNVGTDPLQAAATAKREHIQVDTISIGTASGTIVGKRGATVPVPVSPQQLGQIAAASGGHAYTAPDVDTARQIYAHLAKQLGHHRVNKPLTGSVAGLGLLLLIAGTGASLRLTGRLA